MLAILGAAVAQDTLLIHPSDFPSNYFKASFWQEYDSLGYYTAYSNSPTSDQEAYRMYTTDTLTVYGLAVSLTTHKDLRPDLYNSDDFYYSTMDSLTLKDTSYVDVYDYLRLYEADSSTLRPVGEDLKVHIHTTPVTYYLNTGLRRYSEPEIMLPIIPMYERYFTEPVTIADSFYVGRLFHSHRYAGISASGGPLYTTRPVLLSALSKGTHDAYVRIVIRCDTTVGHLHTYDPDYYVWVYRGGNEFCPLLFPILTPEDTTSHSGGDTLSAGSATLTERLTGVMPNPATDKAKVVSSLGIKEVEVYNAAGDLVIRQRADALSLTLDTRGWPAGTYVVRIATPAGIAVKKLVVGRP